MTWSRTAFLKDKIVVFFYLITKKRAHLEQATPDTQYPLKPFHSEREKKTPVKNATPKTKLPCGFTRRRRRRILYQNVSRNTSALNLYEYNSFIISKLNPVCLGLATVLVGGCFSAEALLRDRVPPEHRNE